MKTDWLIILILALIITLMVTFKKPIQTALSRGYRNNNPGNIRLTYKTDKDGKKYKYKWVGEIDGTDPDFKKFKSMEYGYRAMFVTLNSYLSKGVNTIEKIINRYAPSSDNNNTNAYINTVVNGTGLSKDQIILPEETEKLKEIIEVMSWVENGINADTKQIDKGLLLYQG